MPTEPIQVEERTGLERRAFNLRAAAAAAGEPLLAPKVQVTCDRAAEFLENEVAGLVEQVALFVRCLEYEIRVSEGRGDDEGARLKSMTLAIAREALARASHQPA